MGTNRKLLRGWSQATEFRQIPQPSAALLISQTTLSSILVAWELQEYRLRTSFKIPFMLCDSFFPL